MYYELNSFLESNQANVSELIDDINNELSNVRSKINNLVKNNNHYINDIYNKVFEYSKELGVDDKIIQKENYIFTSDLKSLSGTILSKIIFAFKLAFLTVIEKRLNTKLIFIIDSPGAKEMDKDNFNLILKLLKKELKNNQVFIATLFDINNYEKKYDFNGLAIEPQSNDLYNNIFLNKFHDYVKFLWKKVDQYDKRNYFLLNENSLDE